MSKNENIKKVIVVGGGFGGIKAARVLASHRQVEITLLDRRNHHLFQPLLYQVAMAGLSPADIAVPIRHVFRKNPNVLVVMADVKSVDHEAKKVITDVGDFEFDYCLLACGSRHSYFGNEVWEPNAPGLKTIEQATEIRRRVFMAFERAESTSDPQQQRFCLTFVVIGGGPTGVELAGAIGEISKYTLNKDFRRIDPSRTRIILIEAADRILKSFNASLSKKAARALEQLGVQIWTNSLVSEVTKDSVTVGSEQIHAKTVLWAAGVEPAPINKNLGVGLGPRGRVKVDQDLSVPEYSSIFCVGDQALCVDSTSGRPLPGLAPVAIQQGAHAARNILADIKGQERKPFKYIDKGQLATIGRNAAIMQIGKFRSFGFFAWLVWLFVHIYYLIGFNNRLTVFWRWAWHYFSYSRGARLIIHKKWQQYEKISEKV
ncbi:MAG: NAD(P)/FAD-dependent oxidoreductase [Zetaproteobacteria bacterium]|nr:NAD(P)/FAD-dependent oxidoreductase [Zetaproteobacteria bacterium]